MGQNEIDLAPFQTLSASKELSLGIYISNVVNYLPCITPFRSDCSCGVAFSVMHVQGGCTRAIPLILILQISSSSPQI